MFKTILIIAFVGIVNTANIPSNLPSIEIPVNLPNIDICDFPCTLEANHPICTFDGQNHILLNGECEYKKQQCINAYNEKYIRVPLSECFKRTRFNIDFCGFPCPDILSPVCGYNGQTYQMFDNLCLMGKQACNERHYWLVSQMDNCQVVNKKPKCPEICPLNYDPVCGYDGFNYTVFGNQCNLDLANCNSNSKWSQIRLAICNEKLNYTLELPEQEKLQNNCPKFCTRIFAPVCGSDDEKHNIFSNECLLRKERCEKNQKWHRVIMSECLFREERN